MIYSFRDLLNLRTYIHYSKPQQISLSISSVDRKHQCLRTSNQREMHEVLYEAFGFDSAINHIGGLLRLGEN